MNTDVMFSSGKDDWETPDDLFAELHREFDFTLDVCATADNAKLPDYISEKSLALYWYGRCWMNPPYGRKIGDWVNKARLEASLRAELVCCLLPARTDTAWWHNYIWDSKGHHPHTGVEVRLLRGRLKFKGAPHSAPFPSCVVIFRG
jgi:phage N-6-adenine-methyltransferase